MERIEPRRLEDIDELEPSYDRKTTAKYPHLVWVFTASIADRLDNATWLDTTNELRARGWRVTLIAIGPPGIQEIRGIETLCIPRRDVYLLGHALFHVDVIKYITKYWDEIDIIMFNQDSGVWLFPLLLLRFFRGQGRPKIIMDTRDLSDRKIGSLKSLARGAYIDLNHRLANIVADGQTTITPRFADLVRIPEKHLWGTWPSGVYPELFANAARARKWPKQDEPVKLIYIGVFLNKRHPIELCRAVKAANGRGWNFQLYLVGDGPDADLVYQCAAASDGVVEVIPPVDHKEMPELLATVHIGVTSLPETEDKKYAASSPIKLFEYMASGLPILATTNVCHTDVVGGGSYAFWVDQPTEKGILAGLEQIWAHRGVLNSLGARAQEDVKSWTWGATAAKLDQALRYGLEKPA